VIRVVVVDASLEHRLAVEEILHTDPDVSLTGVACDGRSAVDLVGRTRPDVVIIGLEAEASDCYYAVRQIMAHSPTPILLLADPGRTQGELVAYMLAAGALEAAERPRVHDGFQDTHKCKELLARIRLLARVPVVTHIAGKLRPRRPAPGVRLSAPSARAAVAIVASTGGPMALGQLLSALPADIPAPLFVVQHMADGFIEGLANWFQEHSGLKVRVAENGDLASPGTVLLGPDGCHMVVGRGGVIGLDPSAALTGIRPAGDRLFHTVADVYGARAIGVVLTGMGNDGASGAASIKRAGGRVIAQDRATSTIFGMPSAAIEAGVVDEVLPLDAIGKKLVEWVGR